MKAEQRDRILAAADRFSRDLNNIGLQESFVEGHRLFTKLAEIMERVKTQEQLMELMDSFPDLSWSDERLCLSGFKYGKHFLRLGVLAFADQMRNELPPPPGGRKRLFTVQEEKEVCKFISDLILKGVRLPFAYERAGLHFDASSRSVRRLWEDRAEIAKELRDPDFDTTLEAVKTLILDD